MEFAHPATVYTSPSGGVESRTRLQHELARLATEFVGVPGPETLQGLINFMRQYSTQFVWYKKFQVDVTNGKPAGRLLLENLTKKVSTDTLRFDVEKFELHARQQPSLAALAYDFGNGFDAPWQRALRSASHMADDRSSLL